MSCGSPADRAARCCTVDKDLGHSAPGVAAGGGVVVRRVILRNWLLFGTGIGVLVAIRMYVATERLDRSLAMLGVGVVVGIVGGLVRLAIESRRGSLDREPDPSPSVPLSGVIVALVVGGSAIGAGFARAAGAPLAAYVALMAIAAAVSALSFILSRDSRPK